MPWPASVIAPEYNQKLADYAATLDQTGVAEYRVMLDRLSASLPKENRELQRVKGH